jgi:hypothetical protein
MRKFARAIRIPALGQSATFLKTSSSVLGLYFSATSMENKRFFCMESSNQYRKFAEDCRRFAQLAKSDEQRKLLLEMEAVWAKLSEEAEQQATKSQTL